ncbi:MULTISPECIES: hypothetical protein [unclassified Streptomyces]|uniref:hypothetical protein n=1 Tax=unclassified Streptomyces TaxID=2593676 RepID=UPI002E1983BB
MRARHLALAVATAALLLTGCGGHADTSNTTAPSSPASIPTDLAHLQKMVDGAESTASSAESDMAKD